MFHLQIRVWARREAIAKGQGTYALERAGSILEFFEKYYNVSYPLKKSGETFNFPGEVGCWKVIFISRCYCFKDGKKTQKICRM